VPALKHRLWLKPDELTPGNSATNYMRCYAENTLNGAWQSARKRYGEAVHDWYDNDIPIDKLPLEQVREVAGMLDTVVNNFVARGSRCKSTDWGSNLEDIKGPEVISYLLPEFQGARSIARAVALHTRLAIAERRYDDAIELLRRNYRLGQDVAKELFLVCDLIGIAIEGQANQNLLDLIAAPESPNLYWALAEMPRPLIDCHEAIRFETTIAERISPMLRDAETSHLADDEWARQSLIVLRDFRTVGVWEGFNNPGLTDNANAWHDAFDRTLVTWLSLVAYPAAKDRLISEGIKATEVQRWPVAKVILVDAGREYRRVSDAFEKWWYVPYSEARLRMHEPHSELRSASGLNLGKMIADMLLPALEACRRAEIRAQWQHNAFMVIEALRMHAAETGEFPERLEQIQVVPVPLNPITRNPYVYRRDGQMAVLELPITDGMPGLAWRFEIELVEPPKN
jgi:hypothetical protein